MSVLESKAAGPVWSSRGGEDRPTVPELSAEKLRHCTFLYYDLLRPTMSQYEGPCISIEEFRSRQRRKRLIEADR
ncbi:unnamed protein product [Pleuronectes platessa]|uniref:Uncharacterized protein n=1 Tax=Pleuronectes platessa TaxID=8262 RepID=A0A9N7YF51_PLEPL|nr:unnamed protein product [Pleuronectes platessa]